MPGGIPQDALPEGDVKEDLGGLLAYDSWEGAPRRENVWDTVSSRVATHEDVLRRAIHVQVDDVEIMEVVPQEGAQPHGQEQVVVPRKPVADVPETTNLNSVYGFTARLQTMSLPGCVRGRDHDTVTASHLLAAEFVNRTGWTTVGPGGGEVRYHMENVHDRTPQRLPSTRG